MIYPLMKDKFIKFGFAIYILDQTSFSEEMLGIILLILY